MPLRSLVSFSMGGEVAPSQGHLTEFLTQNMVRMTCLAFWTTRFFQRELRSVSWTLVILDQILTMLLRL